MNLFFHRKPQGPSAPGSVSGQKATPTTPNLPTTANGGGQQGRKSEHAEELPRVVDGDFCYGDQQDN